MLRQSFFSSKAIKIILFLLLFSGSMISARYLATAPTHDIFPKPPEQKTLGAETQRMPTPTSSPSKTLSPTLSPSAKLTSYNGRSVILGMWTEGMWDDPSLTFQPKKLEQVELLIGKKVGIAHFYTGWENLSKDSLLPQLNVVTLHNWTPMISINPYFTSKCSANGKTIYQAIASGFCDSLLHEIGHTLAQFKHPLLIRFAWEMNIDSMPWSIQKVGGEPSDFIASWRHFHDIVMSEGAHTIRWVFSPNTENATSIPTSSLYPGDSYVDWVALDGYNWGTTQSWSSWQSFAAIFSKSYASLRAVAPGKPVMIAEVNSTEKGGDKAEWYKDMLLTQIPQNFPGIKAVVFYNEDRTAKEQVNWLISSSTRSQNAFKEALSSPLYRSSY